MAPDLLGRIVGIGPRDGLVVLRVRAHSQKIQAVQLVEDFDADTVPGLARVGVCDLHSVIWLLQLWEVRFGDHLIRNLTSLAGVSGLLFEDVGGVHTVCDIHPRILHLFREADVLRSVERLC